MNTQAILNNENLTKTEKIRQLLALGLTRKEVANLTGGNYGFVQNVFAKYWPSQVQSKGVFHPLTFNKKFGIEIEAYGVSRSKVLTAIRTKGIRIEDESYNHITRGWWKIVSDSSISGESGFEIVSPILEGQAGLEELKKVCEALTEVRAKINKSCGMHVHFDASQMGIREVKNLMLNYATYEKHIDSILPNSRRGNTNNYCQSLQNDKTKIEIATSVRELASAIGTRYRKINLQSFVRHGSIEFRQHSGTIEFEKIKNWVLFLHNLVDFSKKKKVEQAEATFESFQKFNQEEIYNYLYNRKNDLNA